MSDRKLHCSAFEFSTKNDSRIVRVAPQVLQAESIGDFHNIIY